MTPNLGATPQPGNPAAGSAILIQPEYVRPGVPAGGVCQLDTEEIEIPAFKRDCRLGPVSYTHLTLPTKRKV